MVYGIAQRHRATLEIDSELGRGTTFRFRFPILTQEAENKTHADVDLARSLQVLVVDDQEFMCEIIVNFLEADCHVAEAVTNGRDALERIAVKNFDLLITDQAMPDMNGGQLALEAKRRNPYTRVILLTGFGEGERPEVGGEAIDLVAGKPITRMALRKAVADVLISRGSGSE
jgi:CheY-like chemotaxis protein